MYRVSEKCWPCTHKTGQLNPWIAEMMQIKYVISCERLQAHFYRKTIEVRCKERVQDVNTFVFLCKQCSHTPVYEYSADLCFTCTWRGCVDMTFRPYTRNILSLMNITIVQSLLYTFLVCSFNLWPNRYFLKSDLSDHTKKYYNKYRIFRYYREPSNLVELYVLSNNTM